MLNWQITYWNYHKYLFRKHNMFLYFTLITSVILVVQWTFTLVFLSWPVPYLTMDIVSPLINMLLRYLRICFDCAETSLAEMTSQNLAHDETQLSLRKRSFYISRKLSRVGTFWENLKHIGESNKKLEKVMPFFLCFFCLFVCLFFGNHEVEDRFMIFSLMEFEIT